MIEQVLVAVITFLVFFYFFNRNKRLPPGPWRLPVVGSFIQIILADPKFPHLAQAKLAEKYGDIFSFGFGDKLAVTLSSYESIRHVLKVNDANLSRYNMPFVEDRNFGKNLGILFASGQKWIDMRSFTKKVLREYGYNKIETPVMGRYLWNLLNFNIVWALIGGYKFEPNHRPLIRAMKGLSKVSIAYGTGNIYNSFPFMKTWFPKLVNYPEHLKIHKEIHGFSKFLIDDAIEKRSARPDTDPTSFIEVFLDKMDEEQGNPDSMFTMQQLQITLEDLFLASMETTGNLLNWAILFMVDNPDKQIKVRQAIFDNGANKDIISATELKQIPYVKATILEVMRIGNVSPLPTTRLATADLKYRDYILPKDTVLFYNLHPVYTDEAFWEDTKTFRPERFLNESGGIDQSKSDRILKTVFGVGPRVCCGESFGMDSTYTFFAALIANFKFESIPGREPSVENYHFVLTKCPDEFSVKVTELSI